MNVDERNRLLRTVGFLLPVFYLWPRIGPDSISPQPDFL